MNYNLPDELLEITTSKEYATYVVNAFNRYNVRKHSFFKNYNYNKLARIFEAYLAFEYDNQETDDLKLAFLETLKHEIFIEAYVTDFIRMFKESSMSQYDIQMEMAKDALALQELRSYSENEFYKSLDRYNLTIAELINKEEPIMSRQYRYDMEEIIILTKCFIVKDMVKVEDPYDIINMADRDVKEIETALINAFDIYKNGIKTEAERKLSNSIALRKLSMVIDILRGNGYFR